MGLIARVTRAAAKSLPLPGSGFSFGSSWAYAIGRSSGSESWRGSIGDGSQTSIVEACINYMARTFPEAPPMLWKRDRDGAEAPLPDHPLVALLARPTPFHSGPLLWMATLASFVIDGNAYWLKVRAGGSGGGRVIQLWYVPHWMIEPKSDDAANAYITHYDFAPRGRTVRVAPSEVVHFRHGIDPDNIRKGRSPIADQLREVFTDEEASRFTASLIRNYGVPGLIAAPERGVELDEAEMEATKLKLMSKTGGEARGEPLVMSAAMKVTQFGFSPTQLDLSGLRDIPEERITAALGLPASVVGFGSGLQTAKVGATMRELREQAWEGCIIPTQRLLAADLAVQLLPEFFTGSALSMVRLGFDLSEVRVLQEDENKRIERERAVLLAGGMLRSEFRSGLGLPVTPADDVFYVPLGVSITPRDELSASEPEPATDALPAAQETPADADESEGVPGEGEPQEPPQEPSKRRLPARATPDAVTDELLRLRSEIAKTAAARLAKDAENDRLTEAVRAVERTAAAQGAAFVEGMRHVAEAIAAKPTELVITPAASAPRTTIKDVERDERGNILRIVETPVPAAIEQNGHGGTSE